MWWLLRSACSLDPAQWLGEGGGNQLRLHAEVRGLGTWELVRGLGFLCCLPGGVGGKIQYQKSSTENTKLYLKMSGKNIEFLTGAER